MLAAPGRMNITDLDLDLWTFDVKMDGLRVAVDWDGWTCRLWSRRGVELTDKFPELTMSASKLGPKPCTLDGELVSASGSFAAIQWREKQQPATAMRLARDEPAQFFAFDCLQFDDSPTDRMPWIERRDLVEALVPRDDPHWRYTIVGKQPEFPQITRDLGMEGVIAKLDAGTYLAGVRSDRWLKFKNTHRVTVYSDRYTEGKGARERTFGALEIAVFGGGRRHPVGRVGSGFTEGDIRLAKQVIDNHGYVLADVNCLGVTKNGQLRQPTLNRLYVSEGVFDASQCSLEQLHDLPTT